MIVQQYGRGRGWGRATKLTYFMYLATVTNMTSLLDYLVNPSITSFVMSHQACLGGGIGSTVLVDRSIDNSQLLLFGKLHIPSQSFALASSFQASKRSTLVFVN